MAKGSKRVVYVALAGNACIAGAKFVAFLVSGSGAMLNETIHSAVDTVDQILLLVGQARARKRRDRSHPLGYGMEMYFWSFIVALIVFGLVGVVSIYEGVQRLTGSSEVTSPALSLTVLAIAVVFEGTSFAVGYREFRRIVGGRQTPFWRFIVASKDPNLFSTLLEDLAALIGIGFAAAGVIGSALLHIWWADGAASIAIGLLLMGVSAVLANETRSLIAGEGVAPPIMTELRRALSSAGYDEHVQELATLHLGPRVILVAITMHFASDARVSDLREAVRSMTRTLRDADERVTYVYVRPA